jgi:hypothetical protein
VGVTEAVAVNVDAAEIEGRELRVDDELRVD